MLKATKLFFVILQKNNYEFMIPWSISTTVRNPERIRDFLRILKTIEGEIFNSNTQIKFQILLIQNHLYTPTNLDAKYQPYFDDLTQPMPYEIAETVFHSKNYEDPPMRGRQSANPINKLGFAISRDNVGPIQITELGNHFLIGDYDLSFVFFKCFIKLQFPSPWSSDFSEKKGFNINPFIATLQLINKINQVSNQKGISKTEFCYFIPTLINANDIDSYVEIILEYRKSNKKEEYVNKFLLNFYKTSKLTETQINNLFDYGDNTIRYFRLTKYIRVSLDALGSFTNIDLEPTRLTEINQLLTKYDGSALKFKNTEEYLDYLSDIDKPTLPWHEIKNLQKIANCLINLINETLIQKSIKLSVNQQGLLNKDYSKFTISQLESFISELRQTNLEINELKKRNELKTNTEKITELINILTDKKRISKIDPTQFEKLIADAFKVLDDEIKIQPNYPTDDNGEPISHAVGNKPDIECYYKNFKSTVEVTLNTTKMQWVLEGQPIMRHLRDFENKYSKDEIYCVFVAPKIHTDTLSTYWHATKYEYDGIPQKIVPFTTEQFSVLLQTHLELAQNGKKLYHKDLQTIYNEITSVKSIKGFSDWSLQIHKIIENWKTQTLSSR